MLRVGASQCHPKLFMAWANELAKKLKYLKNPRISRLMRMFAALMALPYRWYCSIITPLAKLHNEVNAMSPKNRQSHQP